MNERMPNANENNTWVSNSFGKHNIEEPTPKEKEQFVEILKDKVNNYKDI